jgi:uncharacterized membrane protein YcaP (DUF421 family)
MPCDHWSRKRRNFYTVCCHSERSEESSYFEQFGQLRHMLISSDSRVNQLPQLIEVAGCFASLNMTYLAFHSHGFGILVKGRADVIVRDGECDFPVMRRNHLSTHDLDEDMRLSAHTDDLSSVRLARVERSGDISFIKK